MEEKREVFASAATETNKRFTNLINKYLEELDGISDEKDIEFFEKKIQLLGDIARTAHILKL